MIREIYKMFQNKILITRTERTTVLGLTIYRFIDRDIVLGSSIQKINNPIIQNEWAKTRNTALPIGNDIGIYLEDWEDFVKNLGVITPNTK